MSLLVTGSLGIDTIESPAGRRDEVVGGSAVYFSLAASLFTPVRLVGVVGDDAPAEMLEVLRNRDIDTAGLERRAGSKTFRWHGSYVNDLNQAESIRTDLNVLAEAAPKVPEAFADSQYVFLANTHPAIQRSMAESLGQAKLIVADTMNLWINNERAELAKLMSGIHGMVLNDGEVRLLTGETNLVAAAKVVLKMGPKFVVIKKGEHGSLMCWDKEPFILPAFPAEVVIDPTGAGDSFAGGMMGFLASQGTLDAKTLRKAVAYGTVTASYTIADFSTGGLAPVTRDQLDTRYATLQRAVTF